MGSRVQSLIRSILKLSSFKDFSLVLARLQTGNLNNRKTFDSRKSSTERNQSHLDCLNFIFLFGNAEKFTIGNGSFGRLGLAVRESCNERLKIGGVSKLLRRMSVACQEGWEVREAFIDPHNEWNVLFMSSNFKRS